MEGTTSGVHITVHYSRNQPRVVVVVVIFILISISSTIECSPILVSPLSNGQENKLLHLVESKNYSKKEVNKG